MNIVLITEKPTISRMLGHYAQAHWPEATIYMVSLVPYTNLRLVYPHGLKWSDYPVIDTPRSAKASWDRWVGYSYTMKDGLPVEIKLSQALFSQADEIIYACDPDATGAVSFHTFMRLQFGDDRAMDCPSLCLADLSSEALQRAFMTIMPFGQRFARHLDAGLTKRYFDWHWNSNALAILQESAEFAGVPREAFPLSKYGLQLLYALRRYETQHELRKRTGPFHEVELIKLMQNWTGTGHHAPRAGVSLGSPASYAKIIDNLLAIGHLQRMPDDITQCRLTPQAHAYLATLHPDCEDPDLPFRIDDWCQAGLEASKPAINRYIRTWFGKQERFLAKLKRERNARV